MPDDERFEMMHNLGEKVVELEKKIQIADAFQLHKRIEKLECKVAENREYAIQLKELYDKELSELKASSASHTEKEDMMKFDEKINREIKELKSGVNGLLSLYEHNKVRSYKNREVLRELSFVVKRLAISGTIKKETLEEHWKKMEEILKKLNGGEKAPKEYIMDKEGTVLYETGDDSPRIKAFKKAGLNVVSTSKEVHKLFREEKPPEQDAGSARQTECLEPIKSDALDALLHAIPDHFKIDWWIEQLRIFVPGYKLVEKADLEFVFSKDPEFMNMEELKRRRKIKEKYLTEEAEKKE